MGILDSHPLVAFILVPTVFLVVTTVYRLYLHPLAHIPGPLPARINSLWLYYHSYIGDEATVLHEAHLKYGSLLRIAPNQVDISDPDAIAPIYVTKGGFLKAPCYGNFDIDGHKTIFSTFDAEYRTPRAKAVVPMFSAKALRDNEVALYGCVDRFVNRMEEEASTGRPVNVLNIARSLAVDAVSTHLFQENYNGTSEKGKRLSVSAFVDAFVAVGRFFYLPGFVFIWLEWAIEKVAPSEHTNQSMEVVDQFVSQLVDNTADGKVTENFPGRLLNIGLSRSEVKAQCKDLIFAGTDSTGMNLATLCRQLSLHPEKHERLRKEVLANYGASPAADGHKKVDIQSLPYLSATIREGLRISMANPVRFPHIVPPSGWTFKSTFFPPHTIVGCSAYELHFNTDVYGPDAKEFRPERWLEEEQWDKSEMGKSFFAWGAGSRQCIARNLATVELFMAVEKLVERGTLQGSQAVGGEVEIYEWFNSSVKGEKIELIWEGKR